MKTELESLIYNIEKSRYLTKFYLSKLKEIDPERSIKVGETTINSVYWIVGHLAWAENTLGIRSCGGEYLKYPWLKYFGIGKNINDAPANTLPSYQELYQAFKEIHIATIVFLEKLDGHLLDQPNLINFEFATEKTIRMCIAHVARHEATHTGQLALICKILNIKTI